MTPTSFNQNMLPTFSKIDPASLVDELKSRVVANRKKIDQLLSQEHYTWDNLMAPLEDMGDELAKFWSPISHLHGVKETEDFRKAYNQAIPVLTEYQTAISQNKKLYEAIVFLANSEAYDQYNDEQKKIIQNDLRDFKLAGIHLSEEKKAKLAELQQRLSQLATKFSENVLDATQSWHLLIKDLHQLRGLPEQALQLAKRRANKRQLEGYLLTLDFPSYSSALKFLEDRKLRQTLYEAYTTRASDQGPEASKWDNTKVMEDILQTRHDIAQLVGFEHYADLSLATKMAGSVNDVLNFLQDLLQRSKAMAHKEYEEIADLAFKLDGLKNIEVWDLSYYSEKLSESKFKFTQEDLRPYFPIDRVLNGLFTLVNKLYGITIHKDPSIETWHEDAAFYAIYDRGRLRGGFYIDLYAREGKRDGAWMDDCRDRRVLANGDIQLPVAYLTCNFMPPIHNKPALLTHDEVMTLFHEFGHCLHHMLTKVKHPSVGGINGVPWDAVEFPSQFMENFCYEKEVLELIAGHYQTQEPLPHDLYQKMLDAKHFQAGLQMVRQIEFSLFDFRIHLEWDASKPKLIQHILNDVRVQSAVIAVPEFNRFQHSFSHIFAGGYAAGYYSYKWAEVLSADAYSKFEEEGLLNESVGKAFMHNILEVGGVRDPMKSFVAFRGRKPSIDALLKQSGIQS